MKAAMNWIQTEADAVRKDVERLGMDGAVEYQMKLIADRQASGDHRWDEVTEKQMMKAMREALLGKRSFL